MDDKTDSSIHARPLKDTVAGTGPDIPDNALAPGDELPTPPSDEEVAEIERKLDAPVADAKKPR